jgi:dihydroorotase
MNASAPVRTLTLRRPDDWHIHLRDGAALAAMVPAAARQFARAIVMPNLRPPVTTVEAARRYRDAIVAQVPEGVSFEPLMTLYLTDRTDADEVARVADSGFVHAFKYYPAGATTNSDSGVTAIERVTPAIEAMARLGVPLLMHGEVTDPSIDIFDRERVFLETVLEPLRRRHPELRVVLEHITTAEAARYVESAPGDIGATLTAQHLLLNRNAIFEGGIRPHAYCLPVLKRETHRQALLAAATSGNPRFFLGTDSAPHARENKESGCGHAGIYTAHAAIELYAEAFDSVGALDRLEAFASLNGPRFYRLAPNETRITLERDDWTVPASYPLGDSVVVPLRAGQVLPWRLC